MFSPMDARSALHAKRLCDALSKIEGIRGNGDDAHSPSFENWKDRAGQTLKVLFGEEHDYSERFKRLSFWDMRISLGGQRFWTREDQDQFEHDLSLAEQILRDAIEELELAGQVPSAAAGSPPSPKPPAVVVHVNNILSQTTSVSLEQVLVGLGDIGLSELDLQRARTAAQELEAEAKGEQRWPVLSGPLEALRQLGKSVYERVAIPILLEMLRRQAGL